ncbi:hypothetical protein GM418_14555 [Maribellus comscasis]|uniref:Uncharacterized protein n=1 Tax=Maribellus comscasis TaxID=2681766 RepID=A0A6I6K0C0_9BACT|nr:hypothetical protein [Maribellus comscasis]QGY44843.1 hypothetical protein GM418_14555 [Maribellus comscasis]
MIGTILTIVMTVVFFKMIFQWIFGKGGNGLTQFFGEVFTIMGKIIGFFLKLIWKIFRGLFRLLIYNPRRR